MRSIPVDVNAFTGFMCVNPPEPKVANLDTGEVRKDRDGNTLYVVGVVAMRGRDSSVIQVTVPGEPKGLGMGTALRLHALEAVPWDREGRSGVAYRAAAVTPLETSADPGAARRGVSALTPPAGGPARGGDAN